MIKQFFITLLCLIIGNFCLAKGSLNKDSLSLESFNKLGSVSEKIDWLFKSEIPDVNKFVLKHQQAFDSLVNIVENSNDDFMKYKLSSIDGFLYYHQDKYQKAVPIFIKLLSQRKYITQKDSVRLIVNLKNCFGRLLNYPKVFEMHQMLNAMAERNPEIRLKDLGLPLSSIYIRMGLISEGVRFLKSEYKKNPNKHTDRYAEINFYNNLGVVWNKANKPDSAIYYFKKAEQIIDQILVEDQKNLFHIFFKGLIVGNIGQAMIEKKQFSEAIPLLKQDIKSSISYGNLLNAAISYNELARCYFECKNYQSAEVFLDSSTNFLNMVDAPAEQLKNLRLKAELLSLTNRYKESVVFYKLYNELNDSIAANEKELLMLNQQIAFQTNKLQEKIELQDKEMLSKKLTEEKRNIQRVLMFVLLLMMLILLIFGYFNNLKSKKREKELSAKNEEITIKSEMIGAALKEKELLIKEVHHRVKNNMQIIISLLKLQSDKINDKQVEIYFSEARNRIQSMALIHEFLYKKDKMDYMQMDEYIKQLILEIQISYTQPNHIIEIHTDLDPIQLDFDTSIPLGLIINELVTNSYKHAFPNKVGNIWVSFKKEENTYKLIVKDNGKGASEDFKEKMENSLGMELIHLLSNQINAVLEIKEKPGFEVKIVFVN